MSSRAACRLAALGFDEVFDYAPGKEDWAAMGLPIEGEMAKSPRAGELARTDAPTASPDTTIGVVRKLIEGSDWSTCLVVDEDGVLVGRVLASDLDGMDEAMPATEVMDPGPSTLRYSVSQWELLAYLRRNRLDTTVITTSDGRLVGMVKREDVEPPIPPGRPPTFPDEPEED